MNKLLFTILAITAVAGVIAIFVSEPIIAQNSTSPDLLQGVKAEQDRYSLGECIKCIYVLQNRSDQTLTYQFPNSKQYDIWIKIGDKEVYRHSSGRVYATAFSSIVLKPCETKTFEIVWNQLNKNGKNVGPGVYDIYAQLATSKNQLPATVGKVKIGVGKIALVPVTISEAIKRIGELLGKRVQIQATYQGWQPNADDPNIKDGPPITRSDWAICDGGSCMYVNGKIDLDPVKGVGTKINVIGKLQQMKNGQVYLVLENVVIQK